MQTVKTEPDARQSASAFRLCGVVAGTRLLTPDGYRPVETLSPGDLVRLALPGQASFEPITWMGRRDVILSQRQQADFPVQIRRHALADGNPARDVWLAQEHAVYIEGKLYLARDLNNGGSIAVERRRRSVTYWGVQLGRHNVLLADNLPVESVLPVCAPAFTPAPSADGRPPISPHQDHQAGAGLRLEIEVRTALNTVTQLLLEKGVKADFAILPQLTAQMKRHVLQEILTAMLRHAIISVVDGRLLLTAVRNGDHAVITVTFSGKASRERHEADLRASQQAASLQGAQFEVVVSPDMAAALSLQVKGGLEGA